MRRKVVYDGITARVQIGIFLKVTSHENLSSMLKKKCNKENFKKIFSQKISQRQRSLKVMNPLWLNS